MLPLLRWTEIKIYNKSKRRRRFNLKVFLSHAAAIAGEITTIAGGLDICTSLGGCKVALDKTNNQEDGEVN